MHYIRMRFFDFVEKDDRIGPTPHCFGKLAAFLIPDVARRRTNQSGGSEFFHVLRHVDLDQGVGVAEHEFGQRAREIGFADTGRAKKDKGTNRPLWIFQIGA